MHVLGGEQSQCWPAGVDLFGPADVNACSLHGKDATCVR